MPGFGLKRLPLSFIPLNEEAATVVLGGGISAAVLWATTFKARTR